MGVYKYICCINVQEKPVGLLEAPQSNIHPLRRPQTVEVKASESSMKVSEGVYIYIYMHAWLDSLWSWSKVFFNLMNDKAYSFVYIHECFVKAHVELICFYSQTFWTSKKGGCS